MLKSFIMSIFINIIIIVSLVYLGINAYLYFFQRSILYLPVKEMSGPKNYGLYDAEEIRINTDDGINITAWYIPPKHNEPVMLYLHGNAGNLGDRTEKLEAFLNKGFGMLAVSWRGYGTSDGEPTEEGLYNDARAAFKYLKYLGFSDKDIFFYGESLGSGVAVQLATEHEARAVILEAPYTAIVDRAAQLYPYIPVKMLVKDKFNSLVKIPDVHIPVLIFHGYLDEVMPITHGRAILNAANEPKEARFFEQVGHTDFNFSELANVTYNFVKNHK